VEPTRLHRRSLLAGLAGVIPLTAPGHARSRARSSIPDLEGVWSSYSATSLERPAAFTDQWTTPQAARAFQAKRDKGPPPEADKIGQFTSEWWDRAEMTQMGGRVLTSFIVDPPDGRLPYTAEGRAVLEAKVKATQEDASGPETRDTVERCLYGIAGPPLVSASFGALFEILQTRDQVAIFSELIHDMRLIELRSPRGPAPPPSWTGASSGRYEAGALVVETKGFHPLLTLRDDGLYLSPAAIVRERFRRISAGEILYEYEVEDPSVFTQVWRAMMVLKRTDAAMYEYACHEGNYGLADILAGAREEERAAKSSDK
jgi:hypothetical protein